MVQPEDAAIQLVMFDCDGVMFDTEDANRAYYNHILDHFGAPPLTDPQFDYVHMHTAQESVDHIFADPETRAAAQAFRLTLSYQPFLQYMRIEPDLKPLIDRIRPPRLTAVATNRSDTMGRVLETHGLRDYFDMVVTSLDVQHPKPHPESLVKILRHFDLPADRSLYIGDSPLDEMAARAAGVPFAAFRNPQLQARWHIDRLADVVQLPI